MSKTQKILIALGLASAVGITYVLTALKGLPETLSMEDDNNE
jgi:hypothetical protein